MADVGASFAQGLGIAQQIRALQQQKEAHAQAKAKFEAQKIDLLSKKLLQIGFAPKELKAPLTKAYIMQAQTLGVAVDENAVKLMTSEQWGKTTVQGLNALVGLPQDKKAEAGTQLLLSLSDVDTAMKILPDIAAQQARAKNMQLDQLRTQQQLAMAGTQQAGERVKIADAVTNTVRNQTATAQKVIESVNDLNEIGSDPKRRKEAFASDSALVMIAKISDPQTGVREGEVQRVTGLGTGALGEIQNYARRLASGQVLNNEQWRQLLSVANLRAKRAQLYMTQVEKQRSPELAQAGIDPKNVFGTFLQYTPFDFKRQFRNVPPGLDLKSLQAAGAAVPDQTAVAAAGSALSESQRAALKRAGYDDAAISAYEEMKKTKSTEVPKVPASTPSAGAGQQGTPQLPAQAAPPAEVSAEPDMAAMSQASPDMGPGVAPPEEE